MHRAGPALGGGVNVGSDDSPNPEFWFLTPIGNGMLRIYATAIERARERPHRAGGVWTLRTGIAAARMDTFELADGREACLK